MDEELHLNERAYKILDELKTQVPVKEHENVRLLDFGVNHSPKSALKLGLRVAEACTGGLGKVEMRGNELYIEFNKNPALATLGCQLAGWGIKINKKEGLGSGPARIQAKKPKVFVDKLKYSESSEKVALILETDLLPSAEVCKEVLAETQGNELLIAAFRGDSQVGIINVLSRVVEMVFFRLDFMKFDTLNVGKASGSVLFPKTPDIFSCNDAIRYNGRVSIETFDWNPALTEKAVSSSSKAYGKSFKEIFDEVGNFYDINPEVFAPAELEVLDINTGERYHAGKRIQRKKV